MRQRIITSIVLLVVLVPTIFIGGWPFNFVMGLIALLASIELIRMAKINRQLLPSIVTYLGTLSIVFFDYLAVYLPDNWSNSFTPIFSLMFLLICTVVIHDYDFTKAGVSALTMFYVGLGGYAAVTIRNSHLALFLFILLVVMSTDIGAYFIGSQIGKNKLAPQLSPNKTIEGFIGGIMSAILVAFIYLIFFDFRYSKGIMLLVAGILSVTGQFGDLLESSFKRHFSVKDSGKILPGHGGILDRFDSTLFTLSMAFILGVV
ncbi:MAG TPA: phosphatidate cytidylyltransferase [Candidatus Atopostipes pullistercoris]|uniref:Phosphatidate cytidylyltransferase n=1 Tax=Candidatus Atopostipes pullistercoris TaxID=2838467 RepID=A0A9D2G1L8_9LACT|nr:phosphatidate cytidylyltransferase [Candidatus Atopostipes pullistercoris]